MHTYSRPLSSGTGGSGGARNKEVWVRQKDEAKKEEDRDGEESGKRMWKASSIELESP
jgi:hypothetical protein